LSKQNTIVADNMPLSAGISCVMIHEGFMGLAGMNYFLTQKSRIDFFPFLVFSATFNNISVI
jgi:hypothetical protein